MSAPAIKKRIHCRCSAIYAKDCWQFNGLPGGCQCLCHRPNVRDELLAACDRLLKVESEVGEMPQEQRDWFFGKEGHKDCFTVAHALKRMLTREWD